MKNVCYLSALVLQIKYKQKCEENNFQVSQGLDEVGFFDESLSSLSRLG